jgi:LysM repeat protein
MIYSVRPGDTLFSIAKAQGTTVEKIMDYNFIPSDYTIYPGQQLIIVK